MVIPILMHSSQIGALQARHPKKCDMINVVKLFATAYSISQDILSQIFGVIQSDVAFLKQVHLKDCIFLCVDGVACQL